MAGHDPEHDLSVRRYALERLKVFVILTVAVSLDALFLAVWGVVQWALGQVVDRLELAGVDHRLLVVFQWVFAGISLWAVLVFPGEDAASMTLSAWRRFRGRVKGGPHDAGKTTLSQDQP